MQNFIVFDDVYFSRLNGYDDLKVDVLKNINFVVSRGDFVAIVGKNGCGKSTLAKHFNGLLLPSRGNIFIDGVNTKSEDKIFDIRKKIGLVFQNPDNQMIYSVVEEEVAFGLENLGIERRIMCEKVKVALQSVNMYEYAKAPTYTLSGGQKQKISIAGVLVMEPDCIIFDEPTSMIEPKSRSNILDIITNLNRKYKMTVILITHDIHEILPANRVFVMDNGKIACETTPERMFNDVEFMLKYDLLPTHSIQLLYNLKKEGYNVGNMWPDVQICTHNVLSILEENKVC